VTTPAEQPTSGLGYLPGLDGIRAFALMPVLLFHAGFAWVPGAMFGLSTFFTMSGYLITSLLIEEHKGTGGIGLGEFWRRRFRRLLPASLLAMLLAIAFGIFAADAVQRAELGGDIAASLAYVANWWFIGTGQSYADLFAEPSPLLHIWSLAVEEQFYLVLPLLAWVFLRRRSAAVPLRKLLIGFGAVVAVIWAATTALPFIFDISDDFFYYATPTRLPEMLAGVGLALIFAPGTRRRALSSARLAPAATVGGLAAVAVMVWLWANVGLGTPWVYRGGFAAFSLVSIVLILAMHNPHTILTKALTIPPMLHLGRISYGVYLFHWPIFLWITPLRTGLDGWPLFALRMAVVLALAEASFRLVETPIRRTGRLFVAGAWRPLGRLAPVAIAALVVGGVLTSVTAPEPTIDLARSEANLVELNEELTTPPTTLALNDVLDDTDDTELDIEALESLLPLEPPPLRASVFGDSSALMSTLGVGRWASQQPDAQYAFGASMVGCGLQRSGDKYFSAERIESLNEWCARWPVYWQQRARASQPNTAYVQVGPWELIDRRQGDSEEFIGPGDPGWDDLVLEDMLTAVDTLNGEGAFVAWATAPVPNANLKPSQAIGPDRFFGDMDNLAPERFAAYNELVAQLPALRPGRVAVVDLAGWHAAQGDRDLTLRPDGVHVGDDGSVEVANEFLGPELQRLFREAWTDGEARRMTAEAIVSWQQQPGLQEWQPGEPVRVVVWSTGQADDIAAAIEARSDIPTDVVVVSEPQCGIVRTNLRRTSAGVETVDPACFDRDALAAAVDEHQPHLVLFGPGIFELADHMPFFERELWVFPGEPFGELWLTDEMGVLVDELRATGAMIGLINVDPAVGPAVGVANPGERVSALNIVVRHLTEAPARQEWITLVDVSQGGGPGPGVSLTLDRVIAALTSAQDSSPTGTPNGTPNGQENP